MVIIYWGLVGSYVFVIFVLVVYLLFVCLLSLGWWYGSVIINLRVGDFFLVLFFYDNECQSMLLKRKQWVREIFDFFGEGGEMFWGGDEVLRWLRRYVEIERSVVELNVYLVELSQEDLEGFGGKVIVGGRVGLVVGGGVFGLLSLRDISKDGGMDFFMKFIKEMGWNIMEKFSKVMIFMR